MKKTLLLFLLSAALALSACGASGDVPDGGGTYYVEDADLIIYAASSLKLALGEIAERYREDAPQVRLRFQFASSGDLFAQIRDGARCDLFLTDLPSHLDALDGSFLGDWERNPDNLDLLISDTRTEFLENRVALAVPPGNPRKIRNFAHMSALLRQNAVLLSVGGAGTPLGGYTRKIFDYYYLSESAASRSLLYASDEGEAAMRVRAGMADGGVLYLTDADGLTVVDTADASMCGRVLYAAAVMSGSASPRAASGFLDYLAGPAASEIFIRDGFLIPAADAAPEVSWEAAVPDDWTEVPEGDFPEEPPAEDLPAEDWEE